jgi:chemotaxis protein MotB
MKKHTIYQLFVITAVVAAGCVPARKLEDVTAKKEKCEEALSTTRAENLELRTRNEELGKTVNELKSDKARLEKDTTDNGIAYRKLTALYNELTNSYEKLLANNEKLSQGKAEETRKALASLQTAQEELFRKEDELRKKEASMEEMSAKLKARESRIAELEALINKQDSTLKALKNNLTQALIGYKDKGITVEERNGMIYVSMEERLLFASGSIVVDKNGETALNDVAKALARNPDLQILIEGHTDNVPITTSCIKDNWDLSVLRATSVVRILMKNSGIKPIQLVPSGRGEYLPIDPANTSEARRKNRRIEIILMPNVAELMKAVGQ